MWGLRTIALLSISSHINMMSVQLPDTITFNIATNWVQGGDMCFFSLDWDKDVLLDFAIYKSMGPLSSGSTSLKNLFGYYIDSYLFICPHFLSKRWEKGGLNGVWCLWNTDSGQSTFVCTDQSINVKLLFEPMSCVII